ncbi:MAG: glycosyl hydrolase family 95 catalytic domain-containing protein [Pirellulaceae bacterium]
MRLLLLGSLLVLCSAVTGLASHTITVTQPILVPEDGLLLGNGDLSVSVYQTRDRLIFRFGKGDVWDRRVDYSDDPQPPTIQEIAHGIGVERWKCNPYGDGEAVALQGTDNPQRMKELCKGTPPSYFRRPYPCPKPVGELALQIPPDLPGLSVRQELALEEGLLRVSCSWPVGVEVRLTCFIPPQPNVLVVRWELAGWGKETEIGNNLPPIWFWLYRWADPTIKEFGQRFAGEFLHDGFSAYPEAAKCSPLPQPSVRVLHERTLVEQAFPAEPTFPYGFRYFMVPYVSEGSFYNTDMSAMGEARIRIWPPATARSGWIAVAVPSESDSDGAEAELARINALLLDEPAKRLAEWEEAAHKDAARFWSRSAVQIADPLIEGLWYETLHARRCTTKAGKTPPGLFLPSTVMDYSHWHGDYHTNYNYQQPFYADYVANQLEVGDAYFTGMDYLLQMGKIIAEKYYGTRGVFIQLSGYPIQAVDDVLGAVPMGRMAYMTGWASNQYWWRYLYTKDEQWLRQVGYPVLRDCALFYLDFMQKGDDGLYHVFPSNQGEDGFTGDPKDYTDRPQIMRHLRYCLRSAIQASEILNVDPDLREQWHDRLDQAAGDDGKPAAKWEGLVKHFSEACPPEFGDGAPPAGPAQDNNLEVWPGAGQWVDLWYAGQYPIGAISAIRGGRLDPDRVFGGMKRIVERWRHPNGLIWAMPVANYGHCGAWTETLGIAAPLQEMLLQSYGGVLRVFPCWPAGVAASFTTLRAEGAFLVNAAWKEGSVVSLEILSEKGGTCRLATPWPEGVQVETTAGQSVALTQWAAGVLAFETTAGETYRVRRPQH